MNWTGIVKCTKRLLGVFETSFTARKRNKILHYERRFETKFYLRKNSSKRNEKIFGVKIFRNFSIVTHECHGPLSKIHVTMVDGRSLCWIRFACKACSSHGVESNFSRFGFESMTKRNCLVFKTKQKRNQNKAILRRNETEVVKYFRSEHSQKLPSF